MSETQEKIKGIKGNLRSKISLNEEQKLGKVVVLNSAITIITGAPGSGKTTLAAMCALDLLAKKEIDCIDLYHPTVEVGKSLGLLPGSISEKIDPYFESFYDALNDCKNETTKIDKMISEDKLRSRPLQFLRGLNFGNGKLVILDETQNTTITEIMAFVSRICIGSKVILLGDNLQQDTKEAVNGLKYLMDMSTQLDEIKMVKLKENHRHPLVEKMWNYHIAKQKLQE